MGDCEWQLLIGIYLPSPLFHLGLTPLILMADHGGPFISVLLIHMS